jgi:hypothetical protein
MISPIVALASVKLMALLCDVVVGANPRMTFTLLAHFGLDVSLDSQTYLCIANSGKEKAKSLDPDETMQQEHVIISLHLLENVMVGFELIQLECGVS